MDESITKAGETAAPFTNSPDLAEYRVTSAEFLESQPAPYDGVCVAAYVFNPDGKLLLVQRAASDSMPLLWEVPGGAVDHEDASMLHAVERELREESGLQLTNVTARVGGTWSFHTTRGRYIIKQSFLAEVSAYDKVILDPKEHANFVWVSEEEARAKRSGDLIIQYTHGNQEAMVYEAFAIRKAQQTS